MIVEGSSWRDSGVPYPCSFLDVRVAPLIYHKRPHVLLPIPLIEVCEPKPSVKMLLIAAEDKSKRRH